MNITKAKKILYFSYVAGEVCLVRDNVLGAVQTRVNHRHNESRFTYPAEPSSLYVQRCTTPTHNHGK